MLSHTFCAVALAVAALAAPAAAQVTASQCQGFASTLQDRSRYGIAANDPAADQRMLEACANVPGNWYLLDRPAPVAPTAPQTFVDLIRTCVAVVHGAPNYNNRFDAYYNQATSKIEYDPSAPDGIFPFNRCMAEHGHPLVVEQRNPFTGAWE